MSLVHIVFGSKPDHRLSGEAVLFPATPDSGDLCLIRDSFAASHDYHRVGGFDSDGFAFDKSLGARLSQGRCGMRLEPEQGLLALRVGGKILAEAPHFYLRIDNRHCTYELEDDEGLPLAHWSTSNAWRDASGGPLDGALEIVPDSWYSSIVKVETGVRSRPSALAC
jgi:hypothetical protein